MPVFAHISQRQLEEIAGDAEEVVLEHEARSSSALVAMMHCGDRGTSSGAHEGPNFPTVDRGCSSTSQRTSRAVALYQMTLGPLQGQSSRYLGIGGAKSTGKNKFPCGLEMKTSGFVVRNILSNELDKRELLHVVESRDTQVQRAW